MSNVRDVFNDRKEEIEFYFSVILDIENGNALNTVDNAKFFRIMKSNFVLMLYNLVEATTTSGMLEIYEALKDNTTSYDMLITQIQKIWREYKIKEIYKPDSKLQTYTKRVEEIINTITQDIPIELHKNMIGIDGNLNAKRIKEICDRHSIRYRVIDDNLVLEDIRKKRNALAHGDDSFGRCARDLSVADLESIKDVVINFLSGIVEGMEQYCINKKYLVSNS